MGARPPNNFLGAKNYTVCAWCWHRANSSELVYGGSVLYGGCVKKAWTSECIKSSFNCSLLCHCVLVWKYIIAHNLFRMVFQSSAESSCDHFYNLLSVSLPVQMFSVCLSWSSGWLLPPQYFSVLCLFSLDLGTGPKRLQTFVLEFLLLSDFQSTGNKTFSFRSRSPLNWILIGDSIPYFRTVSDF